MDPNIVILTEKKLVGISLKMTLSNNRTRELWQGFMPRRKEISNTLSANLFSMQVYDNAFNFKDLNLDTEFEKWAAVEVSDFYQIPENMNTYILKGGLYLVFTYKGLPSEYYKTFQYIFSSWLPASEYEVDNREHFEILGEKYKNNDSSSEEDIWIPVKKKK